MSFEMISYRKLVSMTKETFDAAMVPLRVRQAKAKADLKSGQIEENMMTLEKEIHELCAKKDIDLDAIAEKIDKYDLQERRLKQINELIAKLFPEGGDE